MTKCDGQGKSYASWLRGSGERTAEIASRRRWAGKEEGRQGHGDGDGGDDGNDSDEDGDGDEQDASWVMVDGDGDGVGSSSQTSTRSAFCLFGTLSSFHAVWAGRGPVPGKVSSACLGYPNGF